MSREGIERVNKAAQRVSSKLVQRTGRSGRPFSIRDESLVLHFYKEGELKQKPLHSTASPEYVAGRGMGLAEADDGFGTGDRVARRALTSSSRGSVAVGFQDFIPGLR